VYSPLFYFSSQCDLLSCREAIWVTEFIQVSLST
jgi:hypothetical protein